MRFKRNHTNYIFFTAQIILPIELAKPSQRTQLCGGRLAVLVTDTDSLFSTIIIMPNLPCPWTMKWVDMDMVMVSDTYQCLAVSECQYSDSDSVTVSVVTVTSVLKS